MDRMPTIIIFNNIKRILFLIALVTLLTSCTTSYNSLQLIHDCSTRYESVVKTENCAQQTAQRLRQEGASIYVSDQGLLTYWSGLVYKVQSNQISDREAWTRFRDYQVKQNAAAAENARQIGEVSDGLNCLLFGVACN